MHSSIIEKQNQNYILHNLKIHKLLVLTILTFIGIVLYELHIHPSQILPRLFGENRSFAILLKDNEFVLLDQKTKFFINRNEIIQQFAYMDYDTGMINGEIDIHSINEITVIQGNRAKKLGTVGLKAGFLGGFLLVGGATLVGEGPGGSGEDSVLPTLMSGLICGAIDGLALGAAGTVIGSRIPNITTYKVASNHWQFADIDNLLLK